MTKPYIAYTKNTKKMAPKLKHIYYISSNKKGNFVISEMLESPGQTHRQLTGRYSNMFPFAQLINKKFIHKLPYYINHKSKSVIFKINNNISFNAPLKRVEKYLKLKSKTTVKVKTKSKKPTKK